MKLPPFLLPALLALSFTGPSQAQVVLFSNLLQDRDGAAGFDQAETLLATDFLTDGTPRTITSLSAKLSNSSLAATHHVTFGIFTDDGSGKPGTLVSAFGTRAEIAPGSSLGTATSLGINLQPSTKYWVVGQVNESGSGDVIWGFNLSNRTDAISPFSPVPLTPFLRSNNGGSIWVPSDDGNFLFSLEGHITPVPEPETWLALLVTVGGFGTFRWWTNRKAS